MRNSKVHSDILTLADQALSVLDRQVVIEDLQQIAYWMGHGDGDRADQLVRLLDYNSDFRERLVTEYRQMEKDLEIILDRNSQNQRMMAFLSTFLNQHELKSVSGAFKRWMDAAAVREKARTALHHRERISEIVIQLLAAQVSNELSENLSPDIWQEQSSRLKLDQRLWREFDETPRWQNRVTVIRFWIKLREVHQGSPGKSFFPSDRIRKLVELFLDQHEYVWVRTSAVEMWHRLEPGKAVAAIKNVFLDKQEDRNGLYLKAALLTFLKKAAPEEVIDFLKLIFTEPDKSEHVCITGAKMMDEIPLETAIELLSGLLSKKLKAGKWAKVTAAAVISLVRNAQAFKRLNKPKNNPDLLLKQVLEILAEVMKRNSEVLPVRAAIEGSAELLLPAENKQDHDDISENEFIVLQALDFIIEHAEYSHLLRRLACSMREKILVLRRPEALKLRKEIEQKSDGLMEGESFKISKNLCSDKVLLGRVLAVISAEDFGYAAEENSKNWIIYKGDVYRRKLWRVLSELFRLDPSKRQGFLHSVGREMRGGVRTHPRLLAEMAETKVLGERLYISSEASWRPYIPTVDDILSLCTGKLAGREVLVFSSEGILKIKGPKSSWQRFRLFLKITMGYKSLAQRRNFSAEQLEDSMSRGFVQYSVEELGIAIEYQPHLYRFKGSNYQAMDPVVVRNLYPAIGEERS